MAKINVRGTTEVARAKTVERLDEDGLPAHTEFLLRSDGKVLRRMKWKAKTYGGKIESNGTGWTIMGSLKTITADNLRAVLAKRGYELQP